MTDIFKGKQVLITGGAGVIGQELVRCLASYGAVVRVVDLAERPEMLDCEYYRLDLADPNANYLFRFRPEYVFHLAADFERTTETENFLYSNFRNNLLASHILLEKLATVSPKPKKIVFASSYLVYDEGLYTSTSGPVSLSEDDKITPRNLCGISKLYFEKELASWCKENVVQHASARIFRAYGCGGREIISRWAKAFVEYRPVDVWNVHNSYDYIYASDIAEALMLLAEETKYTCYNVGTGVSTSISELVAAYGNELQCRYAADAQSAERSCANMQRFLSEFPDFCKKCTDIQNGVKKVKNWELGQKLRKMLL